MTDNRKPLTRRTALKGLATAGVAAAGGAAYLTRGASASSTADYGSVAISSDDGTVEYVAIYGDSVVTWDGFDTPATQFGLIIEATPDGGNTTRLYETGATSANDFTGTNHPVGKVSLDDDTWGNHDEDLSGSGTSGTIKTGIGLASDGTHDGTIDWHVVGSDPDGYGLPFQSVPASALENPDDGTTDNRTVWVASTYIWYDSNDNEIFRKKFSSSVDVEVTNEATTASGSSGTETDGATGA